MIFVLHLRYASPSSNSLILFLTKIVSLISNSNILITAFHYNEYGNIFRMCCILDLFSLSTIVLCLSACWLSINMLYRGRNNVYDITIVDKLTKIEYYGEKIVSILVK